MTLAAPYPVELLHVAKKVAWYDIPEKTLADLPAFLAQVMVYGSAADVGTVERFVPVEEFRKVLQSAPAGVFTEEAWRLGTKDSACLYPRRHGGGSRMDPSVPSQADSSADSHGPGMACLRATTIRTQAGFSGISATAEG